MMPAVPPAMGPHMQWVRPGMMPGVPMPYPIYQQVCVCVLWGRTVVHDCSSGSSTAAGDAHAHMHTRTRRKGPAPSTPAHASPCVCVCAGCVLHLLQMIPTAMGPMPAHMAPQGMHAYMAAPAGMQQAATVAGA
jgi:hypothetical protein